MVPRKVSLIIVIKTRFRPCRSFKASFKHRKEQAKPIKSDILRGAEI
jgi:hypothetical protein